MLLDKVSPKFSFLCRCGFFLALALITLMAMAPQDQVVDGLGWDKANHSVAFFTLIVLLDYAYPRLAILPYKHFFLVLYGVFIEGIQALTPDRFASVEDVFADIVGLLVYGVLRQSLYVLYAKLSASEV